MTLDDKLALTAHLKVFCSQKINFIKSQINALSDGAANDAKSSAGDKHETAISMMQLEQEKLNKQMVQWQNMAEAISKINTNNTSKLAAFGSIVTTNKQIYFISVAAGKIEFNQQQVVCISLQAPLAKLLLQKTVGNSFSFNGEAETILELI